MTKQKLNRLAKKQTLNQTEVAALSNYFWWCADHGISLTLLEKNLLLKIEGKEQIKRLNHLNNYNPPMVKNKRLVRYDEVADSGFDFGRGGLFEELERELVAKGA